MKILFLFLVPLLFFSETFATIWTVDDDGTAQFTKIQDAVNAASTGDTVFVYNGIYKENVIIPVKSISLIGENRDSTRIVIYKENMSSPNTIFSHEKLFISSFTLDGRFESEIGIRLSSNSEILNTTIKNHTYCAIKIPFGSSSPNSNILLKDNNIVNNHYGIFYEVDYPGHPDSIKIIGNTISYNERGIVYFPMQVLSGPPFDTTWNIDADSNYWGYNNADSIAGSIWDKNDSDKAIAQLHYNYWYSDSLDNQTANISTGIHHNNIYNNSLYNVYAFNDQGTGIDEVSTIQPNDFRLSQNYPNPFNNQTIIPFQIDKKGTWSLTVYNLSGQKVEVLFYNRVYAPGQYSIKWKSDIPSGIYFIHLSDGKVKQIIKTILLK